MMVPIGIVEFDHTDAAFDQATGQQTVRGKGRFVRLDAVEVKRPSAFGRHIGQLRNARLHAKGHFVLGDAGGDLGITEHVEPLLVKPTNRVEHTTTVALVEIGGILQIEDRFLAAAELDALIERGQETGGPQVRTRAGQASALQDDVGG